MSDVANVTYLQYVRVDQDMFQAPAGQIRVFTTTRAALDAARRPGADDFDNSAHPLFYMGSDAAWDYYYLADHAFAMFFRVDREKNQQENRTPLMGDSLAWREVKPTAAATTRKS